MCTGNTLVDALIAPWFGIYVFVYYAFRRLCSCSVFCQQFNCEIVDYSNVLTQLIEHSQ